MESDRRRLLMARADAVLEVNKRHCPCRTPRVRPSTMRAVEMDDIKTIKMDTRPNRGKEPINTFVKRRSFKSQLLVSLQIFQQPWYAEWRWLWLPKWSKTQLRRSHLFPAENSNPAPAASTGWVCFAPGAPGRILHHRQAQPEPPAAECRKRCHKWGGHSRLLFYAIAAEIFGRGGQSVCGL